MDNKKSSKHNKLLLLTFACALVSLVFYYFGQQKVESLSLHRSFNSLLDAELIKVKEELSADISLENLVFQNSPYSIFIESNDGLTYWNDFERSLGTHQNSLVSKEILKNFIDGNKISVYLDLSEGGRANKISSDVFNFTITQKKEEIFLQSENSESTFYTNLSYIGYLLALLFILIYFYHKGITNRSIKTYSFIGLLLIVFHNLITPIAFQYSFFGNFINETSITNSSLSVLIGNLVLFGFFIKQFSRLKLFSNVPSRVQQVLAPFSITALFLYLCYLIKGFLHSEPLSSVYDVILQYEWNGIVYLITTIVGVFMIFYASIVLFSSPNRSSSGIEKYSLWLLGILSTYPISHWLNIEIPVWTIYIFMISYFLILELFLENAGRKIIYTFWWIIIFSGFIASVTFYYRLENNQKIQSKIVESLYHSEDQTNLSASNSIDQALQASDVFVQLSSLPYPSGLDKNDFEAYVKSILQNSNLYADSIQLDLVVNDKEGNTLFQNHFNTSYTHVQSLNHSDQKTEYLYYNPFEQTYYLNYFIENEAYQTSPFNFILKLQYGIIPVDDNLDKINYAISKNGQVIKNQINDHDNIPVRNFENIDESLISNDISYTVFNPKKNIKIIAYNKIGGLIKPISLFSFVVSLSGLLIFLLSIFNTQFKVLPSELNFRFYDTSSLRVKIQVTIIMLIVFSFLVIGIVTAFYFKKVLDNNNLKSQKEEINAVLNDIRTGVEGAENNELSATILQSRIEELAHVHNKNLTLFTSDGTLAKSSFTIPSLARMPYNIVKNFKNKNEFSEFSLKLDNGYKTDFIPIYYKEINPYGYLGVTYQPLNDANQSIRDFLSTILNVYIFLFLIAGALAIAIGNSITRPLAKLSEKLKEFKLGKSNESLDWSSKDEIGNLIKEYNLLTKKLDESANLLARTERDMAWREMAKQVAHEIKNPLTPMKLSMQYLERAVKSDPANSQELIGRVSATLIEQINNLSQIADEFSNFAKMPKASNEKIVLNEIVEAIHDLFRKREDMVILMSEPINDMYIFADRNHVVRILNNIVKNAIQAIPTDRKGRIEIALKQIGDKSVVSVKDNGVGIPDHMKDKVFTPNFTTKSSGTGLGLAISANMIDSFNGRIYFETKAGEGTTFFVEIPLMRLENNFPGQNRVALD